MIEKVIFYAIIGLITFLAVAYLNKGTSLAINSKNDGTIILRINKFYAVLGLLCFLIGLLVSIMLIAENESYSLIIIVLLISWGGGIPCIIYYRNHYLKFNDEIIEVRNFFGKVDFVKWEDISEVSFSHFSGLLTILDIKGDKLKIHQHLVGLITFIEKMETKTKWTANKLNIPIGKKK